jgi:putative zinc finger/helix-turn-helix YgiT family protein
MKKTIDCVNCDGKAHLASAERTIEYKKEQFTVVEQFYKCDACGEEFTTTDTDTVTMNQVYNQYRVKFNIPFPEELTDLREKYGVSSSSMSTILGMGANSYTSYESGEMPNIAMANLIRLAFDMNAFEKLLINVNGQIPNSMYERAMSVIKESKSDSDWDFGIDLGHIGSYDICNAMPASEFTGYRKPDINRIANLLVYALSQSKSEYNDRLKMNKLLFYVDFCHYRQTARSITGLPYRAIQYGPVPTCYDTVLDRLENMEVLEAHWINHGRSHQPREIFEATRSFNEHVFSIEENCTIRLVVEKFKNISSWDIVELSHKENGWLDNKEEKKKISYQNYAFDLKAL